MRICRDLYAQLVEHALLEAPKECCGLIACRDGEAVRVHPCANAADSEYRFEIDGTEQWNYTMKMAEEGLQLGAIYHSHTHAEPYPSTLDIMMAAYRDVLYIIVGVAAEEPVATPGRVHAFTIRDGQVTRVDLDVI